MNNNLYALIVEGAAEEGILKISNQNIPPVVKTTFTTRGIFLISKKSIIHRITLQLLVPHISPVSLDS